MTNLRMSADDRRRVATAFAVVALVALVAPKALAQDDHVLIESDKFEYKAGPASLDEGAEYAVLYGNPGEAGLFALRLKLPDGFHIAPHHHEQPEVVTVISGTFRLAMGEEASPDDTTVLEPGSFFARDGALRLCRGRYGHSAQQHRTLDDHLYSQRRRPRACKSPGSRACSIHSMPARTMCCAGNGRRR